MIERGESLEVIQEDYPYLSELDLKFAPLYVKAYPIMGRPKKARSQIYRLRKAIKLLIKFDSFEILVKSFPANILNNKLHNNHLRYN